MEFCEIIEQERAAKCMRPVEELSVHELSALLAGAVMRTVGAQWASDVAARKTRRAAYYFSAEFLMGRAIFNNLASLHLTEQADAYLKSHGRDLGELEEIEDAALGNGGLGRLAACFLDSAATHRIPLTGYGIRYRYGLFKQSFRNGDQVESADDWARFGDPWSIRRDAETQKVALCGQTVLAVPYDTPIVGYDGAINTLRLFACESEQSFDFAAFDRGETIAAYRKRIDAEKISAVLYPNDSTASGRKLRLCQEYFFCAAGIGDIVRRLESAGIDPKRVCDYAAVQLNDTHPVLAVPELIRVLMEKGCDFDEAYQIAKRTFNYTNHTIMAEALEKWGAPLVRKVCPEVFEIIRRIDAEAAKEITAKGGDAASMRILDRGTVHMARLAIFMSARTNGVAKVHTEILKSDTLKDWYALYPERFHNKTNGVTPRRWLYLANPKLGDFITARIGDGWIKNADELEKLAPYANDVGSLRAFAAVKKANKQRLCDHILQKEGIKLSPDFIFDVQAKRLHEYKRQLLNAFGIVRIAQGIQSGEIQNFYPTVFLFGAKAAPGYRRAKGIIRYIHEIAAFVNNDPVLCKKLKVVFVTDYNVSYAEKLLTAGDVSEQISAAGTEASGTGNMKLAMSGAVTLGTYDGANIEIVDAAGEGNNYIFGARVEELQRIRDTYDARGYYDADPNLRRVVDTLVDGTFDDGGSGAFRELYDSLLVGASWHRPDQYFLFRDFNEYIDARLRVNADYPNTYAFAKKGLLNTAHAGRFSSDRTVKEYADDTWLIKE